MNVLNAVTAAVEQIQPASRTQPSVTPGRRPAMRERSAASLRGHSPMALEPSRGEGDNSKICLFT